MAKNNNRNPFAFTPTILDQDSHEKRRVIKQLPGVHQTETLQKFFGASVDHLFDPGKGKAINGYVGQKPLWYDPDQDYYLEEGSDERTFYQLEAGMVSRSTEGDLTDLLPYSDLINQLRFQGALTNNHNRLFSQNFYTWCPPIDLDKVVNFRQYVWLPVDDVEPASTFEDGPNGWILKDGTPAPVSGPSAGLNKFLGRFVGTPTGEQIVSKTFTLNGNVTATDLQFDFLKLNSWDAIPGIKVSPQAYGPESIFVYINDELAFQFTPVDIQGLGGASLGGGTFDLGDVKGTYNVTSPGQDSFLDSNMAWTDRVYRISISLTGTGKTLKLGFGSNTDEDIDNESMGIDNVRVSQSKNSTTTISVFGPTYTKVSDGKTATYDLPGYGATDAELAKFYDLSLLNSGLIVALVDGESRPFSYTPGQKTITFSQRPAADAEVQVSVYSDLENNAVGQVATDPKAFGGVRLSSGMRITVRLDKNTDYTQGDVWIVENVGRSIFLIKEGINSNATPDYMVVARGARNRNEWSTGNRWFHVSTLSPNLDPDFVQAHRAVRPIVEFNRNVELFSYGQTRRLDVDVLVENIEDVNAYLNQFPQDVTLGGVRIRTRGTNAITVDAVNPDTGTTYGDVESIRLLIRNTVNPLLNNNVFVLVNQGNVLKLILETDGLNPAGTPEYGEVVRVRLGAYQGRNVFWDGSNWVRSQHKSKANQAPLFELYDLNGTSLHDPYLYPNSNFTGSKLFSYKVDDTGTRVADKVLGVPLVHDNKGQILFENFLHTQSFSYVVGGKPVSINGFYFHKDANQLSNDWYAAGKTRQFMVDRYVSDGRTKLFKVSQEAQEISVTLGRVNDSKSFERIALVEDRDFIRVDRDIMILNIKRGDIIEIRSFNVNNPPADATGHYEVPLNLQANPDNDAVSQVTKGDFYDHFSEIMKKQVGFEGAEYADNNYRDTARDTSLGTHIIQHSAGLLKTMLLASQSQLDMTAAIRYSDSEYSRFKDKFQQKILSYVSNNRLTNSTPYDVWINTALDELNKGKTKHFAFYLSGMAKDEANTLPTFIPATPSYLGVYPVYEPALMNEVVETTGGQASVWFLRGHDGSIVQIEDATVAAVCLALEERIFNSIPASIRNRERPVVDFDTAHGDQYRVNDYSHDEWLQILRPSFERWAVTFRQDYTQNTDVDVRNPWTWNWSTQGVPGHWRGIYQKFYGTQRPDLTPWESLGFTIKPIWWDSRYGGAPYTSENLVLWDDLEKGYIHEGDRQGINPAWARPGVSKFIPVDPRGRLRHPGPRSMASDANFPSILMVDGVLDENKCADFEYDTQSYYGLWAPETNFIEHQTVKLLAEDGTVTWIQATASHKSGEDFDATNWKVIEEPVLGCGICPAIPLVTDRLADWNWGDMGPVEQAWRRSSAYAFAAATSGYLMKPAAFVDMGWNTQDLGVFFKGTKSEQIMNQDTKGRPRHADLQVHGEVLENLSLVVKVGVQQWISDLLASKNTSINDNLAEKVRGLGTQLSYKVAGFTDATTLVTVSDAFGRIPSEDVAVTLYRSPSVREENYSGVALEWTGKGYEIYGYDALNPAFQVIDGNSFGPKTSVGSGSATASIPSWRPGTYYSVNMTVKEGDNFFRALKTHTSSSYFEPDFWTQVARPQYADGSRLTWALEAEYGATPRKIAYGTILKTPQDVADFLNGYQRYLESRGWVFDNVDSDQEIKDWKAALANFITWSGSDEREVGDYIALSPSSKLIQFKSDTGTIQPIEQIVNGLYAIVDQYGQPIDYQKTRVVRTDGNLTVSCDSAAGGIFGLRLYISELEHVLVFNNQTIFGDTIYSPLLNIKQPRLRVQGFKTVGWKGRIDAPGFIVTGDTLTPNFERAADDFRRFFETESMENKALQDRARANFGYEEKEYLNNLLLTPTNQFEFYQGMIQQKGSPTSMRRLLRSNFIRHNKGLKLFEEWAFRVGSYGGQEVSPSLDIQIRQSEFKHNPQLITFEQAPKGTVIGDTYGVIKVTDFTNNGVLDSFDERWTWRPEMNQITWPVKEYGPDDLPTAGYVNLDEVRFTVRDDQEFNTLYGDQLDTDNSVNDGDRAWVYGIGKKNTDGSPNFNGWQTYKFNDTGFNMVNVFPGSYQGQGAVVQLDRVVNGFADVSSNPDGFFLSQNLSSGLLDAVGYPVSGEKLILKNLLGSSLLTRQTYTPRFHGKAVVDVDFLSNSNISIMEMMPEPYQMIKSIKVTVSEAFEQGSTLEIGHENDPDFFVAVREEEVRPIYPTNYDKDSVLIQTPPVSYVPGSADVADVDLIRVGKTLDVCGATTVEYEWVRARDQYRLVQQVTFPRPSDYDPSLPSNANYLRTIQVPLMADGEPAGSEGTLIVRTNGVETDRQYLKFVRTQSAGINTVDLTRTMTYTFSKETGFPMYPWNTGLAGTARFMSANLFNTGAKGKMRIEVEYFYIRGFELMQIDEFNNVAPVNVGDQGGTSDVYTWVKTRYPAFSAIPQTAGLWKNGDVVEVDNFNGLWAVYQYQNGWSEGTPLRIQNRKVNSDLLTSAAIFNTKENKQKLVLQLYDPAKGYIPGVADRELEYKMITDPANYAETQYMWGSEQVGQLWWDQSTTRYLDYEIEDDMGHGINYRWKNWGRVAPGITIDVYEWVRSPVLPSGWNDYVLSKANLKIDGKPSGVIENSETVPYVTSEEWNDEAQTDEMVYYFWVKNPSVTPLRPGRKLSAQQVSNIIANPSANDIPFFAVIGKNQVIVGGIKQFLNESDTVLKIKWNLEAEIHNNHHKQWIILREADERNTIQDGLWSKMRDSLVGWDATQKIVPDARLPKAQQVGALIRPRQSWFPAQSSPNGGQRPNRDAREAFVDIMNDVMSEQPFIDQWFNWRDVFETGEAMPTADRYVTTALDLDELKALLPAARNMVQVNECVLIPATDAAAGFWTLWKLVEINGARTFILEDTQKWRMQEGELWNLVDWYDDNWSAKNFPNYRFATTSARDDAGNLDVTLLKGTLVQIDHTDGDNRWTWDVYTSTTKYQVAKHNATIKLSDAFYDNTRTEFGPVQVDALLNAAPAVRLTPDRIQELADMINYRDGSREMEFMLNTMKTILLDTLQKNKVFFGMVKSAFRQSTVIDWAFKTSFLYLGGYSETLRQSPVAFKDQIDNVIAYLEDVKPYHVKIREYVRRLSYGPDIADMAMTDFDKPVYPDGQANRVLNVNNPQDQQIMSLNRPWKDWYNNYQNEAKDISDWDLDWNGVRKMKITMKYDRVSCGTTKGWDTHPWDPSLLVYDQRGGQTRSLSQLTATYRAGRTDGTPNYYKDQAVETIEERNYLVRKGIVTPDRPGTIVTVLETKTHFMWTGTEWAQFQAIGWDQDPDMGMATRMEAYRPLAGMIRADDPNVIEGCGFDGTIISSPFQDGAWDMFEWDSNGWSSEVRERMGTDIDALDGNSTDPLDRGEVIDNVPDGQVKTNMVFRAAGLQAVPNASYILQDGVQIAGITRGLGVMTFNSKNELTGHENFDIHGFFDPPAVNIWEQETARMVAYLNAIPNGTTVIVISNDEPMYHHLENGLPAAMARMGAGPLYLTDGVFKYRSAYILLGKAGIGQGAGREFYRGAVASDASNFIDLTIRMVDGVPYVVSNQSSGVVDPTAIKVEGNTFLQAGINGDRPRELVNIQARETLVINVKRSGSLIQKSHMNTKGAWQDNAVSSTALTFVEYNSKARRVVIQGQLDQEDAQGYTPLHNPQRPSTGFMRDVAISKGYRSNSQVDMTTPGAKVFKLRNSNELQGIPAGLAGNSVRVAIVNADDPTKRAMGELTNQSRNNENISWNGTIEVNIYDDWVDLGTGKNWNIIPLDAYNVPGVVWIGNVRITYTDVTLTNGQWYLTGAMIDGSSLAGIKISPDHDSFEIPAGPVVDGSLQRRLN